MDKMKGHISYIMAVRDRQLDAFGPLFNAPTIGHAIRGFSDEVNREGSDLNKHPEDYELCVIGEYWPADGVIEQHDEHPKQVALASNFINRKGN